MNFNRVPTLERMAVVKIIIALFGQDDVPILSARADMSNRHRDFSAFMERNLTRKIELLNIPKALKHKIICAVMPVCRHLAWGMLCNPFRDAWYDRLSMISFTVQGAFDLKKTFTAMIKDRNSMPVPKRIHLACTFCLEDYIKEMWEEHRSLFWHYTDGDDVRLLLTTDKWLEVYWFFNMRGDFSELDNAIASRQNRRLSRYQVLFEWAVEYERNAMASEYFLQKMSPEEREESLLNCVGKVTLLLYNTDYPPVFATEMLRFLLSQMSEKQQREAFKKHSRKILLSFLHWPLQEYFIEVANRAWEFLSGEDYYLVLLDIARKWEIGYRDANYRKLLSVFWRNSPNCHKRYLRDRFVNFSDAIDLFALENTEILEYIFGGLSPEEKEKSIFAGAYHCYDFVTLRKWSLLRFLIKTCISSQSSLKCFRAKIMGIFYHFSAMDPFPVEDQRVTFLQLMDKFMSKYRGQEGTTDEENNPRKKLRTEE